MSNSGSNKLTKQLHQHDGEPSATLDHPPNIREFDAVSMHLIVSKSPLLQVQLKSMQKEKRERESIKVHNHLVLPPHPFGVYAPAQLPAAVPGPPAIPVQLLPVRSNSLIPETYTEGPKMDIKTFVSIYELPQSILQHFEENAITGTHAFSHISATDLPTMNFKIGEIIDLKEAIKLWATAKG